MFKHTDRNNSIKFFIKQTIIKQSNIYLGLKTSIVYSLTGMFVLFFGQRNTDNFNIII